jgi:hypothetical protein
MRLRRCPSFGPAQGLPASGFAWRPSSRKICLTCLAGALLLSRPLVGEPADPRLSVDERTPRVERRFHPRLEWTVDHIADDNVDFGPFEHKDDFARRELDGVAVEAALACIERRPFSEELGRFRLATVLRRAMIATRCMTAPS